VNLSQTAGPRLIDTASRAAGLRARLVRPESRELLISRLDGSDQESDLTVPPNCEGLGRVRHFKRATAPGWPSNPLPIDPAARALGQTAGDMVRAQVFQNAACAWRCWYCFVPYNLLNADANRGEWATADRLIDLWCRETDRPSVIDLSGGSPDLSPEWVIWMMEALEARGLARETFLWSDDNLSTDYVFSVLGERDRVKLRDYPNYARVCCFKGFDPSSFAFNTGADPSAWEQQFELFAAYLKLGLDLYGYVTLTGPDIDAVAAGIPNLMDRLARIDERLPLRVIPLEITPFAPTLEREARRRDAPHAVSKAVQEAAIRVWQSELDRRFTVQERETSVVDIGLGSRR
jgi:uncharacterized Fe-S cluster-containing radical SAM superfamily protein